ncbi:MAG: zinc ABC transporter substrate-binding protein [Desulfobacterales bacterium]|jgi:zinc transport system substrate-binding protein
MGKAALRLLVLTLLALPVGAGAPAQAKMLVFASILPQRYFIDRVAGDRVEVRVMVPPGASPATYEPKPLQMADLSRASAYFAVGVPFERVWMGKIAAASPSMKVVYTDSGIQKIPMAAHGHGTEGGSAQGGAPDPHIWTAPPLVMLQARHILTALLEIDPAGRDTYQQHYKAFIQELADLDTELLRIFSGPNRLDRFMVFHPSWGYFAQAYGLTQVPIEIEGKAPKPALLKTLIGEARAHGVRVIFAQPQFSAQSAEIIAREIGGQVVFADPLAADWAKNLRKQAEAFRSAME